MGKDSCLRRNDEVGLVGRDILHPPQADEGRDKVNPSTAESVDQGSFVVNPLHHIAPAFRS